MFTLFDYVNMVGCKLSWCYLNSLLHAQSYGLQITSLRSILGILDRWRNHTFTFNMSFDIYHKVAATLHKICYIISAFMFYVTQF